MVQLSVSTEIKDKPRPTKLPLDDTCEVPLERQTIVHLRETSGCCSRRAAGLAIAVLILLAVGGATLAIYLTRHPVNRCFDYGPGCPEEGPVEFYRLYGDEGIGKDFDMPYNAGESSSQSGDRDNHSGDRDSKGGDRKSQSSESNSGSAESERHSGDRHSPSGDHDNNSGDHDSQSGDRKSQSSESNSGSDESDRHSGDRHSQSGDRDNNSGDHDSQSGDRKSQSSESNSRSGESDSQSGETDSRSGESGDRSRSEEETSGGSSESEDRRGRHHGPPRERPIKYDRDGHHPIIDRRPIESWQWRFQPRKHQPGKAGPQGDDNDGHPRRPLMDIPPMMP